MTSFTAPSPATSPVSSPPSSYGGTWRVGILLATAVAAVVATLASPRLPQAVQYFDFADGRLLLGVPNALNVLSNLPFLAVGLAGLAALRPGRVRWNDLRERAPWLVFCVGVALTGAGSAWFHLAPSTGTLVWDRLPMTLGFMGLLCALLAERVDAGWGGRLLWPLVGVGISSVLYWYLSELAGAGDLRLYFLVQYYPLLAVPLLLLLFPARYSRSFTYLAALGAYLLAKVAEVKDTEIYRLGGLVSGHTVKHLLAAAGIGAIVWMLARREPVGMGRGEPGSAA